MLVTVHLHSTNVILHLNKQVVLPTSHFRLSLNNQRRRDVSNGIEFLFVVWFCCLMSHVSSPHQGWTTFKEKLKTFGFLIIVYYTLSKHAHTRAWWCRSANFLSAHHMAINSRRCLSYLDFANRCNNVFLGGSNDTRNTLYDFYQSLLMIIALNNLVPSRMRQQIN